MVVDGTRWVLDGTRWASCAVKCDLCWWRDSLRQLAAKARDKKNWSLQEQLAHYVTSLPIVCPDNSKTCFKCSPSSVWPVDIVVAPATRPVDAPASHVATGPKVLLTLSPNLRCKMRIWVKFMFDSYQSEKLPFFGTAVNGDWSHTILSERLNLLVFLFSGIWLCCKS